MICKVKQSAPCEDQGSGRSIRFLAADRLLGKPVGGMVIPALRLGKAFEPEFGAASHVDFFLQRRITAVGVEELVLRFSKEPNVNDTIHDDFHLLHRILVRHSRDKQFADVCKGNKAVVELAVNGRW
jgi:hypothetical protein